MKKYNTRFIFYSSKTLKNQIRKRAKELDISMSDYIRTLIKKDIKENELKNNIISQNNNIYDINMYNNKLRGYYRGL